MAKKTLIRPEKTDEALFKAFGKLIIEHKLENITVADIIDEANIHRSTFYAHFEDKYELAKDFILRGVDGISEVMQNVLIESREIRQFEATKFFNLLLINRDLIDIAINNIGMHLTFDCMEEGTRDLFTKLINNDGYDGDFNKEILAQFTTGALVGITKWWIRTGMGESPDVVARTFCEICQKIKS